LLRIKASSASGQYSGGQFWTPIPRSGGQFCTPNHIFREQLTKAGTIDELFTSFDVHLKAQGFLAMSGQIIDATIVAATRHRNSEDEKKTIKEGRIPDDWREKPKKLARRIATPAGP
jgi:transposase, IS5 family